MKKTYKIFNGKNRNCFFRVGKTLIKARFTPTYTTDNGIIQKAIEDTYAFKVGVMQLDTSSMHRKASVIHWQTGTPIITGAEYIITDKHSHVATDYWSGKQWLYHNNEDVLSWCLLVDIKPFL